MPKITSDCHEKLLKLSKTRKKLDKLISSKIKKYIEEGYGKNNILHGNEKMSCRKCTLTTPFGAYRLILVDNALIDIVLYDVYSKGVKEDLDQNQKKQVREFYIKCQDVDFWKGLIDF